MILNVVATACTSVFFNYHLIHLQFTFDTINITCFHSTLWWRTSRRSTKISRQSRQITYQQKTQWSHNKHFLSELITLHTSAENCSFSWKTKFSTKVIFQLKQPSIQRFSDFSNWTCTSFKYKYFLPWYLLSTIILIKNLNLDL